MANKIKYGIKNVYYAVKGDSGWGTPVALPGAVSVTMTPQGDKYTFYADNIKYYELAVNNGYEGEIEVALLSDADRVALLGETIDTTKKVLVESVTSSTPVFALGFQIEGDEKAARYWFYNCTASRPTTEGETKEATVEAKTETLSLSCGAGTDGIVRIKTTPETSETDYEAWFTSVVTV